ncbi:MAG: hypothetical protein NTV89_15670 [Proteobacteria bacterium]|nr:hypothetical protein [Pseudomonadota bacterium]
MQPITIEPVSIITLIVVIITFIYGFFKYRAEDKKQAQPVQINKKEYEYEKPAIFAAIAMMMEGTPFKIKNIVPAVKQEKVSSWRISGRQDIMRRRITYS